MASISRHFGSEEPKPSSWGCGNTVRVRRGEGLSGNEKRGEKGGSRGGKRLKELTSACMTLASIAKCWGGEEVI